MSETVKVIIEIPKTTYEDLKAGKIYSSLCEAPQGLIEGIRNGIPLNDVKSAIENKYDDFSNSWDEFAQGKNEMINEVLEMLEEV